MTYTKVLIFLLGKCFVNRRNHSASHWPNHWSYWIRILKSLKYIFW